MASNFQIFLKENKLIGRPVLISLIIIIIYGLTFSWLIIDNLRARDFLNKSLGLGLRENSLKSIKFYQDNGLTGLIFNNYDIGSALIFWLYPKEQVFADNRPEAYSTEFFSETYKPMMQAEAKWQELSGKYQFNLIYFSHTDGTPWAREFLAKRLKDTDWPLVYFDDYTVIMVKDNEAKNLINYC